MRENILLPRLAVLYKNLTAITITDFAAGMMFIGFVKGGISLKRLTGAIPHRLQPNDAALSFTIFELMFIRGED